MTGTPAGRGKKTTAPTGVLEPCERSSVAELGFHSLEKLIEIMKPGDNKEEKVFLLQSKSGNCTAECFAVVHGVLRSFSMTGRCGNSTGMAARDLIAVLTKEVRKVL